jgi:phosphoglycolate phosphatase-like HAD superfamily hydrolase
LTGNVRQGAKQKLAHFGLWDIFAGLGGFGDHHFDRDDVARSALTCLNRHIGTQVEPSRVWVIGDTPLDVKCARAIGAKAVAVATGWHSLDELRQTDADICLTDLTHPTELLRLWLPASW